MHANKTKINRSINIAKGQLEGISKMVSEDVYCLDISNQLLSTIALLKNVNQEILKSHLEHCVLHSNPEQLNEKINEINALLKRMM